MRGAQQQRERACCCFDALLRLRQKILAAAMRLRARCHAAPIITRYLFRFIDADLFFISVVQSVCVQVCVGCVGMCGVW